MRSASLGNNLLYEIALTFYSTPMHTFPRKQYWISPSKTLSLFSYKRLGTGA